MEKNRLITTVSQLYRQPPSQSKPRDPNQQTYRTYKPKKSSKKIDTFAPFKTTLSQPYRNQPTKLITIFQIELPDIEQEDF